MENRTTVYYVDDNPKSSRLLTSVLEECGFRVIAKSDPLEALALCQRTYFDLALLDYEMPLMPGSRLAQEIKFLVPDVPVVLISWRSTLPSAELAFDDLLWTMRFLVRPKPARVADPQADRRAMTQWADST